jgi:hypothetical protein
MDVSRPWAGQREGRFVPVLTRMDGPEGASAMTQNAWFALFIGFALGAPGLGVLIGLVASQVAYRREQRARESLRVSPFATLDKHSRASRPQAERATKGGSRVS